MLLLLWLLEKGNGRRRGDVFEFSFGKSVNEFLLIILSPLNPIEAVDEGIVKRPLLGGPPLLQLFRLRYYFDRRRENHQRCCHLLFSNRIERDKLHPEEHVLVLAAQYLQSNFYIHLCATLLYIYLK